MAYLRREKEIIEVDYPLDKVSNAISETVAFLQWTIEETNNELHQVKVKTKGNFMAYASILTIEARTSKENVTRVTISAETPTTTITGIVDFGRTRERIDSFLLALMSHLKKQEDS